MIAAAQLLRPNRRGILCPEEKIRLEMTGQAQKTQREGGNIAQDFVALR
jgi:hypothetical protein